MDLDAAKEFVGETQVEAAEKAARYFGVPEAQLEIRTLPESLRLSGLGSRVLVLASVKEEPVELGLVGEFIAGVLKRAGAPERLGLFETVEGDETVLTLRSQGVQSWLRHDPRMADALSHLAQRAAEKLIGPEASARVDVPGAAREDGRREGRSRERGGRESESDDALEAMARETAEEVSKTGKSKLLRPMNSKERWVVHNAIKDMQGLRSESIGDGRQRRVKIEPE